MNLNVNSNSELETNSHNIGAKLKFAREYLCLPKEEVADFLNVSTETIEEIEEGKKQLNESEIQKFARIYRRSIDYFIKQTTPFVPDFEKLSRKGSNLSAIDTMELNQFAEFLAYYPKE